MEKDLFAPLADLTGWFPPRNMEHAGSGSFSCAVGSGKGDGSIMLVCTCWSSSPHLKGSAKAQEGWRPLDSQEKEVPGRPKAPGDSPHLAGFVISLLGHWQILHRVPLTPWRYWRRPWIWENESLCWIQERKWAQGLGWGGPQGCRTPRSALLATFLGISVLQPVPVIKPSKLIG